MTVRSALHEVVRLGGFALQAEDCLVRAAVYHRHEHGGLARMENERYHQFVVWRAILPLWDAELERDESNDLILRFEGGDPHYFEMTNWRGATGNAQLPKIRRDIEKLQHQINGYLLVTSINPPEQTVKIFDYLTKKVSGLQEDARQEYKFMTEGRDGNPLEF